MCIEKKKKDVSAVTKQVDSEEDAMHGLPDRTGDLLFPFWLRDPLIQNLRKLQRSTKRRGNGTMLDVLGDFTI